MMNDPIIRNVTKNLMPSSLLRQIAARPALYQAWRKVKANRGAAGIDAVGVHAFERDLDANLAELSRNLLDGTYEPLPSRYVQIPKDNGKARELAIPTVRDRVAQRAVLDRIEPLFEPQMLDCSFAFRAGRSAEMAVQRIVVARAQGRRWTVDADIQDFFPSINHQLLLEDLAAVIDTEDVRHLIKLWLDAGALDGARPTAGFLARWRATLTDAHLAVREAMNGMFKDLLSQKLGVDGDALSANAFTDEALLEEDAVSGEMASAKPSPGKAAVRRLVQDGLLLAIAERAALRGLLSAKGLGLGGAAVALALATPPVVRKLREMASPKTGALQGAPLSPLLSNVYLTAFDRALVARGHKLIRYCDDFVIPCASESEARQAFGDAREALKAKRLQLHSEKSRLVSPTEGFIFLGYEFTTAGRVVPPPNIPEVVARRVVEFTDQTMKRFAGKASRVAVQTESRARSAFGQIKERLKKGRP
ncbi:MAG TPA: reverse transcriptase domain-containing protein [Blastocatellia bacterium]|nr:reverse transcriptase domain-containing protein [Blastocatellia bacterium]